MQLPSYICFVSESLHRHKCSFFDGTPRILAHNSYWFSLLFLFAFPGNGVSHLVLAGEDEQEQQTNGKLMKKEPEKNPQNTHGRKNQRKGGGSSRRGLWAAWSQGPLMTPDLDHDLRGRHIGQRLCESASTAIHSTAGWWWSYAASPACLTWSVLLSACSSWGPHIHL